MSDLLKAAQDHWQEQLGGGELKEIDVPEWGTKIYVNSFRSAAQNAAIARAHKQGEQEFLIEFIVQLARDQNGKQLYQGSVAQKKAREVLSGSHVDAEVVNRVATEILKANQRPQAVEDFEGNSTATQG